MTISLYSVAVKSSLHCCVLLLLSRSSRSHSYFMCWEVEASQMNYTARRWPGSKHSASFAWGFSWAAQQISTYSKRTKGGAFSAEERRFKGANSCKWWPELSWDMRPCNKDKVLRKDWSFEVIRGGSDIMLDLVVILNGEFFRFTVLFIYLTGFLGCCSIHIFSFLP